MRMKPLATALAALATIAAAGAAHAGDGPFTANVGLVSDYAYRGSSQTDLGAAWPRLPSSAPPTTGSPSSPSMPAWISCVAL